MGILGGITGALGGLLSGGPVGAIAGGLAGMSDGKPNTVTAGLKPRAFTPEEQRMMSGAYGSIFNDMRSMTDQQRQDYVNSAANNYYTPMKSQVMEGLNQGMSLNAARNARSGMAGSSKAAGEDQATAIAAGRALADAQAKALMYGNQDYYNLEANRRANLGSSMGLINSAWGNANAGGERYQTTPTSSMGTGLGLMGQAIGSNSQYMTSANRWLGGAAGDAASWLGGLFGGGHGGAAATAPAVSSTMGYNPYLPRQSRGAY